MATLYYTAKELAGLPGLPTSDRRIRDRANRENWLARKRQSGKGMEYSIESLPNETRAHLAASEASKAGKTAAKTAKLKQTLSDAQMQAQREAGMIQATTLTGNAKRRADAKTAIINARSTYIKNSPLSKTKAHEAFCYEYNQSIIRIDDWVREAIPSVHSATVFRWLQRINQEGITGLSGHYGKRKGTSKIDRDPEIKDFIKGMLKEFPDVSYALLYRGLKNRFSSESYDLPGIRSLERWCNTWKANNYDAYLASTNPDAWKSQRMLAFGDAAGHIERLNQEWQLDGTPADVLLEDGRYCLTALVDVHTRRAIMLVTKTAISVANAQLLRKAIINWGMPEVAKTDNGKDYTSLHITRVLTSLGIEQEVSPPFCPQKKPFVERFFRTFSHDVLELMPGFIGHNVAERSAIESRQSFSERLFKKDGTVEIKMTAEQLQKFCDDWCKNIYHQKPHSGINNKTPQQMADEWPLPLRVVNNHRALDLLLQPVVGGTGDGLRTIGKKGIKIGGIHYIAPELAAWSIDHPSEKVLCLQDPDDFGRIMVYGGNEFICIARSDYDGVSRQQVAQKAKQIQQQAVIEAKKELKKAAKKANVKDIAEELLREQNQPNVTRVVTGKDHNTDALTAAADADKARQDIVQSTSQTIANQDARRRISNELLSENKQEQQWPRPFGMNDVEMYRYCKKIKKRLAAGETAPDYVMSFYNSFSKSASFKNIESTYKELGGAHD